MPSISSTNGNAFKTTSVFSKELKLLKASLHDECNDSLSVSVCTPNDQCLIMSISRSKCHPFQALMEMLLRLREFLVKS